MEEIVVAYDGAILDPFMESATTGLAALAQGKPFTGIEASKHYFEVAKERIVATQKNGRLSFRSSARPASRPSLGG